MRLLVFDTRVKHDLGDGAYADLRAGCERAAGLLGLPALRDLRQDGLAAAVDRLPDELRALVRHVVSENERVRLAVKLLLAGRLDALGAVLTACLALAPVPALAPYAYARRRRGHSRSRHGHRPPRAHRRPVLLTVLSALCLATACWLGRATRPRR